MKPWQANIQQQLYTKEGKQIACCVELCGLLPPFFLSLFIYFEKEQVHPSLGGAEREGEREAQAGFCTVSVEPNAGLDTGL